jgi:hypothetical protein
VNTTRVNFLAASLYWASVPALADSQLTYLEGSGEGQGKITIAVKEHQIAFLRGEPGPQSLEALYNQRQQAITFVNHGDRVYTVISREWAVDMRKRVDETIKRMTDAMKKQAEGMPPDLRPYYLQAQTFSPWLSMFSQSAAAPGTAQARKYRPASAGLKTVGRYHCQPAEVHQAGKKVLELCIAEANTLGIPEANDATLREMRNDIFELYKLGAFLFGFAPPGPARIGPEVPGIAVQFRDAAGRGPPTTLKSVSGENVDPAWFQLPPEYLQGAIPLPGPLN